MRGEETLPSSDGSVHAREVGKRLGHEGREDVLELVDVGDDLGDRFVVERERLGYVVEYPEVVNDETVRLTRRGPVCAADRLQERVVTQEFVQVHALEVGRVESRQELRGDDEDLERVARVAEPVEKLLLLVLRAAEALLPLLWRALPERHYDSGLNLLGEDRVERVLVEHASLLVDRNDLSTEALGRDLGLEVGGDVLDNG